MHRAVICFLFHLLKQREDLKVWRQQWISAASVESCKKCQHSFSKKSFICRAHDKNQLFCEPSLWSLSCADEHSKRNIMLRRSTARISPSFRASAKFYCILNRHW